MGRWGAEGAEGAEELRRWGAEGAEGAEEMGRWGAEEKLNIPIHNFQFPIPDSHTTNDK
ncbi:MAG: hypothetical protein F6K41_29555 [Symploca sp. SIO3E6]|nr:hypothetical protein [Caldora sp. SIO3E6]